MHKKEQMNYVAYCQDNELYFTARDGFTSDIGKAKVFSSVSDIRRKNYRGEVYAEEVIVKATLKGKVIPVRQ